VDLTALIASVIVSVGTVGAGYLVARRFQKLGGGEAQERLNTIRKDLDDAMAEKVRLLEEQFQGCKKRLIEVEGSVTTLRAERRQLKQDVDDLHDEIRILRPDRRGAKDRSDNPRFTAIESVGVVALLGGIAGFVFWAAQIADTFFADGPALAWRVVSRFGLWVVFTLSLAVGTGVGIRFRRGAWG
jgi:hypothetical protein